ncbi:MAG TPA: DUF3772 domain-containing protein [Methylocella sp.]|nr:DUF3772 domain-containing protein [Methylocella sp.]
MLNRLAPLFAALALLASVAGPGDAAARVARAKPPERAQGTAAAPKAAPPKNQNSQPAQAAEPSPPPAVPEQAPVGPALDKLSASLKQIESRLENHDLTDADLQALRQQADPVSAALSGVINRLSPKLEGIKARLDQLGPKPPEDAEPESQAVTAERAEQQNLFKETDELLKRARLLAIEADQAASAITARRRALFARSVFARALSIASPELWQSVWQEAPSDAEAAKAAFAEWLAGINARLEGRDKALFWGAVLSVALLYLPLSRLSRRVLARHASHAGPSRLLKAIGAWWVALVIAVPAAAMVSLISLVFQYFGLANDRLQPFMLACGEALVRIAAVAGIARGLFAPSRPSWRLPEVGDKIAEGAVQAATALAAVVGVINIFEALNDIIGASLPVAVAMRGSAAVFGAILLGIELRRFGGPADGEEPSGPPAAARRDWFDLTRAVSWLVTFAILLSVLLGYAAFGSFLLGQFLWAGTVICLLFMSAVLVEEVIGAAFAPTAALGRRIMSSIGIRRTTLELLGVLISGTAKLTLYVLAAFLIVAPWGLQSSDVPFNFASALFGFKIGDVTISPVSILAAVSVFALAFAAIQAMLQWADTNLLPKMNLDAGLRNSIRTSLGYAGFLIAAGMSLRYLGLNFERLALVAGALSVGIGFGLQSIVNNFVSGLILLWERAVRVGDWIVVGSDQGFVRRINVRSTEIETFDRSQVIIPNSNLVSGIVTNLVRNDRTGRLIIPLTVPASADPERVREALLSIAKANPQVLAIPAPQILFTGMSASALNFELRVFVGDVETMFRVKSDLHFAIFRRFKEEKFFETPGPEATRIEIANFDGFSSFLKPGGEDAAPGTPHRGGGMG